MNAPRLTEGLVIMPMTQDEYEEYLNKAESEEDGESNK